MKNYFLFSFFIFSIVTFQPTIAMEKHCIWTPCNTYTQPQVIRRLWDVASNITFLGTKLAETVSNISRNFQESNSTLNTMFAQTLWAVEVYSGFQPNNLSTSCVFERILNLTISESECQHAEYNKTLEDYVTLVGQAIQFTMRTSLDAASCTTSFPPPTQPRPEECISGVSVNTFLEKYGSTIPPYMKYFIKYLNRSSYNQDRTVAVVLSALSKGPLNELFQRVLQTPEMLRAMQLKACLIPITDCCCKSRGEDIRNRLDAVGPVVMRILRELMKN